MAKKKEKVILPKELLSDPEEQKMRILFDFAYYLENLSGKSGLDGATAILRLFLAQRDKTNDSF
jgi:hypothetical protein